MTSQTTSALTEAQRFAVFRQTKVDFDNVENARIEADIHEILGPHGALDTIQAEGGDEIVGWTAFDGALSILRADMPIGSIHAEESEIVEHRRSLLATIVEAYQAGRASVGSAA